jgi:hypothetical protein
MLAPDLGEFPSAPSDDPDLNFDDWVKKVARYIVQLDTKALSCSPKMEAQLTQYARDHLGDLRREIRAGLDTTAALMLFQTHPAVLIEKAKLGDLDALEKLLRINPSLERQPWVRGVLGKVVTNSGISGVESLQQAITDGLEVRKKKLLEIGCMLTLLWPMLDRLTTDQRRGFLKDLGLTAVPKKKALREFERRLNLKSAMERRLDTLEQRVIKRIQGLSE